MRSSIAILLIFLVSIFSISSNVYGQSPSPDIEISCYGLNESNYTLESFENETFSCDLTNPTGYSEVVRLTITVDSSVMWSAPGSATVPATSTITFDVILSKTNESRVGYFTVDVSSTAKVPVFNRCVTYYM